MSGMSRRLCGEITTKEHACFFCFSPLIMSLLLVPRLVVLFYVARLPPQTVETRVVYEIALINSNQCRIHFIHGGEAREIDCYLVTSKHC